MNFKKPLFITFVLLSTSFIGYSKSANSQDASSKVSDNLKPEKAQILSSKSYKYSKQNKTAIKSGWQKIKGQGLELQLPKIYQGGNTKKNPEEFLQRIKKSGIEPNLITNSFKIKEYDLFAVNIEKLYQGEFIAVNVVTENKPPGLSIKNLTNKVAKSFSKTSTGSIDKEIIDLNNYRAGKIIREDSKSGVKQLVYLVEDERKIWIVIYTTQINNFASHLPVFQESIKTFKATAKN
ncbi:MAG: hypothetical protein MJK14_03780 [Rivularia sp. ALOHA_DT_140]|nr:hypothetical protein [Rivularia sp. ALOHA_DT_140]